MKYKKSIIFLSIFILLVVFFYIEIAPEIKRVSENNAKIEEQNKQVIKDRAFGNYDCTYYPDQKVRNCIKIP